MKGSILRLYAAVALLSVSACDNPRPATVPDLRSAAASSPALAAVANSEPLGLERIVIAVRPGTQVGSGRRNCTMCGPTPIHWDAAATDLRDEAFSEQFFETLSAMGYRVTGNPRQMFNREAERASARYLIGAQITGIDLSLDQIDWALTGPSSKGDARLNVTWQVYSLRDQRVVYEKTTTGTGSIHRVGFQGALPALLRNAFADAAIKLGVDRGFQSTVSAASAASGITGAASASPNDDALHIPRFTPFSGPVANRLADLRGSAVTILVRGGHGSGFFISEDGLILTNRHVVGDAETVNVRLLAGVEVVGRVLRRHALRDVALIKVDLTRTRPLPLRSTALRIGEEVYAIGAPVETRLAASVTRGIVSALRRELRAGVELGMIQSDAAIQGGNSGGPLLDGSGNVIGIAVEGYGVAQANAGLNFFVPIDEALSYLNIRRGEPRDLRF